MGGYGFGYGSSRFERLSWGPSCIVEGQAIKTPSGWEGVGNVLSRFRAGRRVEIMVADHLTGEEVASPLLFGLQTMAKATCLTLEDGRVVSLTDGHAVPSTPNGYDEPLDKWGGVLPTRRVNLPKCAERANAREMKFASEEYLQEIFKIPNGRIISHGRPESAYARAAPEWMDRWAPLAVGDIVDGTPIRSIDRIGNQPAARIAPAYVGWVMVRHAPGMPAVRVGTRLHEYPGTWIREDGVCLTSPLNWEAMFDIYDIQRRLDEPASWEFDCKKQRYVITNGAIAWAIQANEPEAAYKHGYLAARAARTARGIRIPEDTTDTLRIVSRARMAAAEDRSERERFAM